MTQPFNGLKAISSPSSVVDVLRYRSFTQPDACAFTFLEDGETETGSLTYQQLDRRSRAIAAHLQALNLSGERALLLYPPGLNYLAAFFGCLYAGVVAVPAYPPRNKRNTPRIQAIVADAQAQVALTTTAILPTVQALLTLENLQWLTTDRLPEGIEATWQEPSINADNLAFLQYTSGSTGTPKGVMLSHGNLLHNATTTYQFMEHSPSSKFVSWLPVYHDMGLIGGILQPLYGGFPCILMPAASFLQHPYRWLQTISQYKGTTSGGPNFAYELCIQKITPQQRETLDLSSWSVAFNGAEPIRHDILERFATTFADCGFRLEAFYPCYGMAETTLMVSGVQKAAAPIIKKVRIAALECNRVVEATSKDEDVYHFVSCGNSIPEQKVVIAHPQTLTRCQPDEVGEVWVSGPSVGQGYWNRIQETEQTFQAYLKDTGDGPFLRTGDLGFVRNGEVFITGRAKDLIIIRGRNLYPQDIEFTTQRSHPSLRSGSGAAFTVEVDNEERLVVVQELEFRAKPNLEEVIAAIRQAVTEEYEVQVYGIVLIKPGSIAKTSSGKIQRRATQTQFLAGELEIIASSITESVNLVAKENCLTRAALLALSPNECQSLLESYLVDLVAEVLLIAPSQINQEQPLTSFGIDSLKVFELKNRIENDLKVTVSVADFFEGCSISDLAKNISSELVTTSRASVPLTQIPRASDFYPVSFAQQQLWFINQLAPDSGAYNINIIFNLTGRLDVAALTQSLKEIIKRHEVLRTNFVVVQGEPVQVVHPDVNFTLPIEDLRLGAECDRIQDVVSQPFDLSSQLLLRGLLLRLADEEYKLILSLHHIIADGWSMGVLIRELTTLYEAFSTLKPSSSLPELPLQYIDFTYWQRQYLQPERINTLLAYWKQQLGGKLPVLNLPTDRPRSPVQSFKGAQAKLVLPPTLTVALKNLSHQEGVTLFMTLLTAFKTLLHRYTGQTDILVGSPIASRNRTDIDPLIGFFVNVLILRSDLSGKPSFRELLTRVRKVALEAYMHQDLPFEKLVEELKSERDLSYNPLFQVMFVLQNVPIPTPNLADISISCEEVDNGTSKFDLTLFIQEREQELVATLEYSTALFNADTINRILGHFGTLLESIVTNPDNAITDMPLLTASEQHQLIVEWNDTNKDYPQNLCIHQLFEQQVERTPDAVAVVFENQQLTYRELNNQANQLADYLQQQGIKPDVLVGICMERSLEMVIALLAILKAGGAYLPLDPAYPKERLEFMLADAQVGVLLTQQHLLETLPEYKLQVVCLDRETTLNIFAKQSTQNSNFNIQNSSHLAYIIYTSGSTGRPKGVQINHACVVNFLCSMKELLGVKDTDVFLAVTSLSFDIAALEIFLPITIGSRVVIVSREVASDGKQLLAMLTHSGATAMQATPATWQLLLQAGWQGKNQLKILCGGEALPQQLADKLLTQAACLWNLYGPTETTIWSTIYQVKSSDTTISIGRPIANTQVYILDSNLQPVPVGVIGELYIGGASLSRGYLNQPELTAEKFIPNLFEKSKENFLYKTGDLARYLPDGNIEFLGRIDHQVKIRGFRIEVGEIESALRQHPGIQAVILQARKDELDNNYLIAYIVPQKQQILTVSEVRSFLKQKFPDYIVPSNFVFLDALPLLPNGKIDRHALPVPGSLRPTLVAAYEAPQTQIEREIAKVWQEVLNLEKVGVNDNFFDLGGHSLLIVKVNHKLQAVLNRDLTIVEMFQNPTIKSLAKYLSQEPEEHYSFSSIRDRAQKQREVLSRRKNLMQHPETIVNNNFNLRR